jgi:hypothetical protein
MGWSTTADAITDLRTQISDGDTDKLAFDKTVVGLVNGDNVNFKTFNVRRLTPLVSATGSPTGAFVNGELVSVTSEDLLSGSFVLADAPMEGDTVTATYYYHWFIDSQLDNFLKTSSRWAFSDMDYTHTPDGLIDAVLYKACAKAYRELAVRFAKLYSEQYRMEDLPKENLKQTQEQYSKLAEMHEKQAEHEMVFFYTRQGKNKQPIFSSINGNVKNVGPNR